jgi:hypothetical protein
MIKAPMNGGGQGLGSHWGRPTARKPSTACQRLGGRSNAATTGMVAFTKATTPKVSSALRRKKVAISNKYWKIFGDKVARSRRGICMGAQRLKGRERRATGDAP